jgi:protein SCO1/2
VKKNYLILAGAVVIVIVLLLLFLRSKEEKQPLRTLPYFDPKDYSGAVRHETHHMVPAFSFTDQYGKTVTDKTTEGKIYVCDYFFTTCHSICPILSNHLVRVYQKYKDRDDFLILSHTVDPETDTVAQLLDYAKRHGVNDEKWLFLTGDKKDLYRLARKGYLLSVEEGDGGEDDFIHTQNFALIDKEKHVRGYYDGTDSLEVTRLINDIQLLIDAYEYEKKK